METTKENEKGLLLEQRLFPTASEDPAKLLEFVRGIRSKEMRSNAQWTKQTLTEQYSKNNTWIAVGKESAIVIVYEVAGFYRLTYYAKDAQCLSEVVELIPKLQSSIVFDLVGKAPSVTAQYEELTEISCFHPYAHFRRMFSDDPKVTDEPVSVEVEEAVPGDEQEIYNMLFEEFDPLKSRLPELDLLSMRILAKDVFVIRKDKQIAGVIVFDSRGKKSSYFNYIVVRPAYRKQGIGRAIWNYKLRCANESSYHYLWVDMERDSAVRFHQKNGFRFDGMEDYIFLIDNKA